MKALTLLSVVFTICGCPLPGSTRAVRVDPPALPSHWRSAFSDIGLCVRIGGSDEVLLPAWESLSIDVLRDALTPVLLEPTVAGRQGLLRPAGGLYPSDARLGPAAGGEILSTDWEGGYLATVVRAALLAGGDPSCLDPEALRESVMDESDPWDVDPFALAAALLEGKESDETPTAEQAALRISASALPGAETTGWILWSPFDTTLYAAVDGWLVLEDLTPGLHRLFSEDGSMYINAWVGGDETAWMTGEIAPPPAAGPRRSPACPAPQSSSPPSCPGSAP